MNEIINRISAREDLNASAKEKLIASELTMAGLSNFVEKTTGKTVDGKAVKTTSTGSTSGTSLGRVTF
jgi:hypothetical protein